MAEGASRMALIERLQGEAQRSPQAYRFKVLMLAVLGFGILVVLLLVALGFPVALAAYALASGRSLGPDFVYVAILPLAFGGLLLRALWMRFDAPPGYRLRPGEAPELERDVERLRVAVGAPPLDGIVVDGELNAAAAHVPRMLGLLGHRHYLVLGLPTMQLLDRDELASVIAHEFGHFGARDDHFTGWIYRARLSWHRVLATMSGSGFVMTRLLAKFYAWYVPYFNAYSFVLARANEYQSDAAAVRATGPQAAASALIRMELATRHLQRGFWPALQARARAQAHPPARLHGDIAMALQSMGAADAGCVVANSARDIDPDDTHPTLAQRLAAMPAAPALSERGQVAAHALLGELVPAIERQLDAQWRKQAEPDWHEAHAAAAADRARLEAIEARMHPSDDDIVQRALLVESLRPDFDALPLYEEAIARVPGNAMLPFRAGQLQLRRGDWRAGLERLRQAMEHDAGAIRPALAALQEFERDAATDVDASAAMAELRAAYADRARSLEARDAVAGEDAFIAHGLDAAALHELEQVLSRHDKVGQAWLARKRFDMVDEAPHFALLVTWRGSVASEAPGLKRLVDTLSLPGSFTVFTDSARDPAVQRVREAGGEPVYRKGR